MAMSRRCCRRFFIDDHEKCRYCTKECLRPQWLQINDLSKWNGYHLSDRSAVENNPGKFETIGQSLTCELMDSASMYPIPGCFIHCLQAHKIFESLIMTQKSVSNNNKGSFLKHKRCRKISTSQVRDGASLRYDNTQKTQGMVGWRGPE